MGIIIYRCSNHELILSKDNECKNCMLKTLQKNNLLYEINRDASLMLSKIFDFGFYLSRIIIPIKSLDEVENINFTVFNPDTYTWIE